MRAKWYISTLFLMFALFGALQKQKTLPNQEVVLEFIDVTVNQQEVKNTLANIKHKLLQSGARNILIQNTSKNTLKISYYSDATVDNIKEVLAIKNKFTLNKNQSEQKKDNTTNYYLDIYQLQDNSDVSKSKDNYILDVKFNSDRFLTSHSSMVLRPLEIDKENLLFKVKYKSNRKRILAKDKSSHTEPEVRAGPYLDFS